MTLKILTYWYWTFTLEIFEKCHLFHVSLDLFIAFARLLGFWQVNVQDVGLHRVNVVLRKSLVVFIESMYRCSCFYLYLFFGCNGNFPERDYINMTSHKKINKKFHQNGVKKTKRFVIWSYLTIWPSLPPCFSGNCSLLSRRLPWTRSACPSPLQHPSRLTWTFRCFDLQRSFRRWGLFKTRQLLIYKSIWKNTKYNVQGTRST